MCIRDRYVGLLFVRNTDGCGGKCNTSSRLTPRTHTSDCLSHVLKYLQAVTQNLISLRDSNYRDSNSNCTVQNMGRALLRKTSDIYQNVGEIMTRKNAVISEGRPTYKIFKSQPKINNKTKKNSATLHL